LYSVIKKIEAKEDLVSITRSGQGDQMSLWKKRPHVCNVAQPIFVKIGALFIFPWKKMPKNRSMSLLKTWQKFAN
jgi:hypothetical protein